MKAYQGGRVEIFNAEWWQQQEKAEGNPSIHANQMKQFCVNGHDTHIVGRYKRWCKECKRQAMRKLYNDKVNK